MLEFYENGTNIYINSYDSIAGIYIVNLYFSEYNLKSTGIFR